MRHTPVLDAVINLLCAVSAVTIMKDHPTYPISFMIGWNFGTITLSAFKVIK